MAHLFVGTLACSGKWRGVLASEMTQPRVVDGLDRVCRGLGGVSRVWRFDRVATVCHPESGRVTASFAGVAKHYGVSVAICPPRRGNRKGVVEKSNHTAAQRWWRTLPDDVTVEAAQDSLDEFCARRGDTRLRTTADGRVTVGTLASGGGLHPMPTRPYPAILTTQRVVSRQALISYRGNRYSVPLELASASVTVTQVLGGDVIDVVTDSGITIARHRLAADGHKERILPGPQALAAAAVLRSGRERSTSVGSCSVQFDSTTTQSDTTALVYDLSVYERAARGRNTPS